MRASSRRPSCLSAWPRPKWPYAADGSISSSRSKALRRARVLPAVVVGPRERLDDRALAWLEAVGALEQHRRLRVMTALAAAPRRAGRAHRRSRARRARTAAPAPRDCRPALPSRANADTRAWHLSGQEEVPGGERHASRSSFARRGLGVMPGIRPRLAIGWPSISFRSPVKSIGSRAGDVRADRVRVDRRALRLEVTDALGVRALR